MPDNDPQYEPALQNRRILGILAAVVVFLVIAGSVTTWLILRRNGQTATNNGNATKNSASATPPTMVDARRGNPATDADHDGLSDDEETTLGTNPNDPDTDHDGLFDLDEVKVYHTDPKKADTDGDGTADGLEVKQGSNPIGSGKLFPTIPPTNTN